MTISLASAGFSYLTLPFAQALQRRGFFERVPQEASVEVTALGDLLQASPQWVRLAMHGAGAMGWVEGDESVGFRRCREVPYWPAQLGLVEHYADAQSAPWERLRADLKALEQSPVAGDRQHAELALAMVLLRHDTPQAIVQGWLAHSAEHGAFVELLQSLGAACEGADDSWRLPLLVDVCALAAAQAPAAGLHGAWQAQVDALVAAEHGGADARDARRVDGPSPELMATAPMLPAQAGVAKELSPSLQVLACESSPRASHTLTALGASQANLLSAWARHLQDVRAALGREPLRVAQAHLPLGPGQSSSHLPQSEGWNLDFLRRLQQPALISADALLVMAAGEGLFCTRQPRRWPARGPVCLASVQEWHKRDYRVRPAQLDDLPRLVELEERCWAHSRTSERGLRRRLVTYPGGQYVLEREGLVLGAIYSQRIEHTDALDACTAATVHHLHTATGPTVQLLAVNIDPAVQDQGYGDHLLEFMLQRCSLVEGVHQVVGVTLCSRFARSGETDLAAYLTGEGGQCDPVLAFHRAHGASVRRPVFAYRPDDEANHTHGVLVAYDIHQRAPTYQRDSGPAQDGDAGGGCALSPSAIRDLVAQSIIERLGEGAPFAPDRPLMEMGLDSAELLLLQQRLEKALGCRYPAGFFFEFNTANKIVSYLEGQAADSADAGTDVRAATDPAPSANPTPSAEPTPSPDLADRDVAIVGMACRLPGGIESPDELWDLLSAEGCAVGEYPSARGPWPDDEQYAAIGRGGFLRDVDAFDAAFFRMSPAEVLVTDPQQRMLLELTWTCLEQAGVSPQELAGTDTGVFVGASNADYSRLRGDGEEPTEAHYATGSSLAVLANRLSYFFDLSGPSMLIDTACSSSLVALHWALRAIEDGQCQQAIVAGVNVICHPHLSLAYHKAGMLSADGLCKVFDATADGYVRAEGGVVLLLRPAREAQRAGCTIQALLKGSAVNHGGLAGGLTVPNPAKQRELLLAAWSDAGIDAADIDYLEAHGTGTALGDPIEVEGIREALRRAGAGAASGGPVALGSIKSNLGHLEPAAGLAGVLKTVLSMRHGERPASIHCERLNPKITLGVDLQVQTRAQRWPRQGRRVAGVSSFGSGGTNAHVVLQDYAPAAPAAEAQARPQLFVLSAPDEASLRRYVDRWVSWLASAPPVDLHDLIFTAQVGRAALPCRLAVRVDSLDALGHALAAWRDQDEDAALAHLWFGDIGASAGVAAGASAPSVVPDPDDLAVAAEAWVSGRAVDWWALYGRGEEGVLPCRIELPTYPFERQSYWPDTDAIATVAQVRRQLTPINTSTFSEQSYRVTLDGTEPFLRDHQVAGAAVLPAVVSLSLARQSLLAALELDDGAALLLSHLAWPTPLVVRGAQDVDIRLWHLDSGEIEFEVATASGEDEGEPVVHCHGRAQEQADSSAVAPPVPLAVLRERLSADPLEAAQIYQRFDAMGLRYGPAHRPLQRLYVGADEILGELQRPEVLADVGDALEASLLDGALQCSIGLLWETLAEDASVLPFALERARVYRPCPARVYVWARESSASGDQVRKLDVNVCDEHGAVCVALEGFSTRVLARGNAGEQAVQRLAFVPRWRPRAQAAPSALRFAAHRVVLCELEADDQALHQATGASTCVRLARAGDDIAARYASLVERLLAQLQEIVAAGVESAQLLQVVVPGGADAEVEAFLGLSGMLKTAQREQPQLVCQLVQLSPALELAALADALRADAVHWRDEVIRHDPAGTQVQTWEELDSPTAQDAVALKEDGVYVITGGLGGLGTVFAQEILQRCAQARVVLTGRRDPGAQTAAAVGAFDDDRVSYAALSLDDEHSVRALLEGLVAAHGEVTGIFHCAGQIEDAYLASKTTDSLRRVLAPKVRGTYALARASADLRLDFLLGFSSVASGLGTAGQVDYAAANGFLDAYLGSVVDGGRAIHWPLWADGGMSISDEQRRQLLQETGMHPLRRESGVKACHDLLQGNERRALVLEGLGDRLRRTVHERVAPRELTALSPSAASGDGPSQEAAEQYLCRELAGVLKLSAQRIDVAAPLERYGIDSILAMSLTSQLEKTFGVLPKTLLFEYQTLRELAAFLVRAYPAQLREATGEASAADGGEADKAPSLAGKGQTTGRRPRPARAARVPTAVKEEPIAIVGLSGRYPQANDVREYWENLRAGRDCVQEVPSSRWTWAEHYSSDRAEPGKHYSKWGGFVDGVDEFDPRFFGISPRDAVHIDPQERLFLEHVWHALEDAGYTRESLREQRLGEESGQVGVYAGVMYSEYQLLGAEAPADEARMGFAGLIASIANRVSYFLDLHGPSMTIDTMCSSSLTAIHTACQDLHQQHTRLAIAGGVNVSVHPNKYRLLSAGQFISSEGQCQSFGVGGDGYIPGEGVGVVLLKRLSDARADGDHIYGLIRGSALSHGGKTNGYTVPNPKAQASVIAKAMRQAGVDARAVSYVEAHGTGTKLGDPIEIAALTNVYRRDTEQSAYCRLGSAKSNIGHCESAAGIAGLTKVLLQMRHGEIVPSLHSQTLNPHIDFPSTPFVVNQELTPWQRPVVDGAEQPRIAGISSFGAGGSNAHLVVSEYEDPRESTAAPAAPAELLVVLSARTAEQLEGRARQLLAEVTRQASSATDQAHAKAWLVRAAYTLQVGREAMEERAGLAVSTLEELRDGLQALLSGDAEAAGVYRGSAKAHKALIGDLSGDEQMAASVQQWLARGKVGRVLSLWVSGLAVDWASLYGASPPLRVGLGAGYPFARERYWLSPDAASGGDDHQLHPLLHRNGSGLEEVCFESTFEGTEWFVSEYGGADGGGELGAGVCLEMARASLSRALESSPTPLILEDLLWGAGAAGERLGALHLALGWSASQTVECELYSALDGEEAVHWQGTVPLDVSPEPNENHDLGALRASLTPLAGWGDAAWVRSIYGPSYRAVSEAWSGEESLLLALELPSSLLRDRARYTLHPALLEAALQGACWLSGAGVGVSLSRRPRRIGRMTVHAPCTSRMTAWVRRAGGAVRVDLCDEAGQVCVRLDDVEHAQVRETEPAPVSATVPLTAALGNAAAPDREAPGRITLEAAAAKCVYRVEGDGASAARGHDERQKPTSTNLRALSGVQAEAGAPVTSRPVVFLRELSRPMVSAASPAALEVYAYGNGVYELRQAPEQALSQALIDGWLASLRWLSSLEDVKALVLRGTHGAPYHSPGEGHALALTAGLYRALLEAPFVVVASLPQGASGTGLILAALSDLVVGTEAATYRAHGVDAGQLHLLERRFDGALAQALVSDEGADPGRTLASLGAGWSIVAPSAVDAQLAEWLSPLVAMPRESLRLLKGQLGRGLDAALEAWERAGVVAHRPARALSSAPALAAAGVHDRWHGDGVLELRLDHAAAPPAQVAALAKVLEGLRAVDGALAVVLRDVSGEGLLGGACDVAQLAQLSACLAHSPVPVLVALGQRCTAFEWLAALHADACVYEGQGRYSADGLLANGKLAAAAARVFEQALGVALGREVLLGGEGFRGDALAARNGALLVDGDPVRAARALARLPRSRGVSDSFDWEGGEGEGPLPVPAATPPSLDGQVVSATLDVDGVLTAQLHDRDARNLFTSALVAQLQALFDYVENTPAVRSVVLTGYDSYFLCGGTKDTLLAIEAGQERFTDLGVYHLPLTCRVPVIAAMQGHAIGAGWSLGLFADLAIHSDESVYLSPYMSYGFTPGAGATLSVPHHCGLDLARESLVCAQPVLGRALSQRNRSLAVVPRADVLDRAVALARRIASAPPAGVAAAKRTYTSTLRAQLDEVYAQELAMHERTLVGCSAVRQRIEQAFLAPQTSASPAATLLRANAAVPQGPTRPAPEVDGTRDAVPVAGLAGVLAQMLATELHLQPADIDEDAQFIDLGLDSIVGVTWMRKINERYSLSLEATTVYSYPTLATLCAYIASLLGDGATVQDDVYAAPSADADPPAAAAPVAASPDASDASPPSAPSGVSTEAPATGAGLARTLRELLAHELHLAPEEVADDVEFISLGMDSIVGVTWIRKINERYALDLEATTVYSYPTLAELTAHLAAQGVGATAEAKVAPTADAEPKAAPAPTPAPALAHDVPPLVSRRARYRRHGAAGSANAVPIAIVGMAGEFPKSPDLDAYWANLEQGQDCTDEVPSARWDVDALYSGDAIEAGKTTCRRMGALDHFDEFDPRFFKLSAQEASCMDPQQRRFLLTAWNTIENAGYAPDTLGGSKCGVFVGCTAGDYLEAAPDELHSARGFTGTASSILAARISYHLNLMGPCISVDTACSSSLVAMANACDSLASGASDVALAGGVFVMSGPAMHIKAAQAGMLSPDGHCYTFDQRANGFVPGEGCGAVLLKRLDDARRDGDRIVAVVRGWGINQDGRTNGITAPNAQSQTALQEEVYRRFAVSADALQLVEAHGTGTKLGDPIEVQGLRAAFAPHTTRAEYCALGSVKSNIGHTITAAGIASVLKVCLALEHQRLPPTINFDRLNEHIDLTGSPFFVNAQSQPWPRPQGGLRQAAISSFGFSGTNAHLVLSEYEDTRDAAGQRPPTHVLAVLSARTAEQLEERARQLLQQVNRQIAAVPDAAHAQAWLVRAAYTLQVGREAMEERAGLAVSTLEELRDGLEAMLAGDGESFGVYRASAKAHKALIGDLSGDEQIRDSVQQWLARGKYGRVLSLWVSGLAVDWASLYGAAPPVRVGLGAGYPFARERYWLSTEAASVADAQQLHPLLHRNRSDLEQVCFESAFDGVEWFIAEYDGRDGAGGLGAGVSLEMAHAALSHALDTPPWPWVLEDLRWGEGAAGERLGALRLALAWSSAQAVECELYSALADEEAVTVHWQATAALDALDQANESHDLGALQASLCPRAEWGVSEWPRDVYGHSYQVVSKAWSGDAGVLLALQLPSSLLGERDRYCLHPALIEGALQGACWSSGAREGRSLALRPRRVGRLTVYGPCTQSMYAWAYRQGPQAALSVDLCDEAGEVRVRFSDIEYAQRADDAAGSWATRGVAPSLPSVMLEASATNCVYHAGGSTPILRPTGAQAKPSEFTLRPPQQPRSPQVASATDSRASVRLTDPASTADSDTATVRVYAYGEGIYGLRQEGDAQALSPAMVNAWCSSLRWLSRREDVKALVLHGTVAAPYHGEGLAHALCLRGGLYRAVLEAPFVVVASLVEGASGPGMVLASLCDFVAGAAHAPYELRGLDAGQLELLRERFGVSASQALVTSDGPLDGRSLAALGIDWSIVDKGVLDEPLEAWLARFAQMPQQSLRLLKQHMSRFLAEGLDAWERRGSGVARSLPAAPSSAFPWASGVSAHAHGEGVLELRIDAHAAPERVLASLSEGLERLEQSAAASALVLSGEGERLLGEGFDAARAGLLVELLGASNLPVVVALGPRADGLEWLLALHADACVYEGDGSYSARGLLDDAALAPVAADVFERQLGAPLGREALLSADRYSGQSLAMRNRSLAVSADGVGAAVARAAALGRVPRASRAVGGPAWVSDASAEVIERSVTPTEPTAVELAGGVVGLSIDAHGVATVRMQEREQSNMFSPALIAGLRDAFAQVASDERCRVVVLAGLPSYFASGGTQADLVALQAGEKRFTDDDIYHLAAECPLPVIAAMAGAARGAGWSLGMFADIPLLCATARYASPYMAYGFTPGAGATHIFPQRLGLGLARESLFTADVTLGDQLRDAGASCRVEEARQVEVVAAALAQRIAAQPRAGLLACKARWRASTLSALPDTYASELTMHEHTLVGSVVVSERVAAHFQEAGQGERAQLPPAPAAALPDPGDGAVEAPPAAVDEQALHGQIRELLAAELQADVSEVGLTSQFIDLGLDSIAGVTFVRKLNSRYGTDLEATVVYAHPTVEELAAHLSTRIAPPATPAAAPAAAPAAPSAAEAAMPHPPLATGEQRLTRQRRRSPRRGESPAIAVIGMAGQYPGARDLVEFWDNLREGRDSVERVPPERWDLNRYYSPGAPQAGKTNCHSMGALAQFDQFDPLFFNISPLEAEEMDPQQRLFLQTCWHSLEHAGYNPRDFSGTRTGVFAGAGTGDYRQFAQAFGSSVSILAARIAYLLDLQGPCLSIDTACSSSLVAVANACDSLVNGNCDAALAGGVCVLSGPAMHIATAQAGMLSTDGRCFTFDSRANGFVPSEGVGVVVLKRLDDAQRDGDAVLGVIRGWGVNQDGKTNGITAPNPDSQARLQREVHQRFAIDPAQIDLIEAHGTGTQLGDPIEIQGLSQAFSGVDASDGHCGLGSVKSNIGHCMFAAGVAGLTKLLLALQHRQLPPTLHHAQTNEHLRLSGTPFYVNDALRPWPAKADGERLAAVSSFGYSGTNAHIVVGDCAPARMAAPSAREAAGPHVVPLAAASAEQLTEYARTLAVRLEALSAEEQGDARLLARIAATLQGGREPMPHRLALVVETLSQLRSALHAVADGETPSNALRGVVEDATVEARQDALDHTPAGLARAWCEGAAVDWPSLLPAGATRRVGLPGYPFAKERYWRSESPEDLAPAAVSDASAPSDAQRIAALLARADDDELATAAVVAALRDVV